MNILIVYAHPEPRSLTGSLKDVAVSVLEHAGHGVQVSDLYAMKFKATADAADFPARDHSERLYYSAASGDAFTHGTQLADVAVEQEKLLRADMVLFVFPLWWFSLPAILKGWIDRVFAYGFGYGVGEHNETHWGDRYGDGTLLGKRSMLIITAGGKPTHYSDRGVNGSIDDLLFPIHHGVLYYPGMDVLPPFVVYGSGSVNEARYCDIAASLEARLRTIETAEPIPFRKQNGGDYELPSLRLKPGLETAHGGGFSLHVSGPNRG